ncbi:helix-turn-helix domain-containing protein [Microvirga sp. BT291]|nr:helix-turn-helix domain-containing protein [Microvirga pudoricolor]
MMHLGQAGPMGVSLKDLASAIGEAKSATHRALTALAQHGFVEGTGRRGFYRLGPAIFGLSNRPSSINELVRQFRSAVVEIAAQVGYSSYLLVRAGFDAMCVDMQEGTAFVQTLTGGVGGRVPLGIGPGSISILASLDERTRAAIIAHNAPRYARYNNTKEGDVLTRLDRGITMGFSYDIGETYADAGGVAVGIRRNGMPLPATLSIAIPSSQLDDSRAAEIASEIRRIMEMHCR